MKARTPLPITLQAARFLKLAGMAMILISLLDFILLPIPISSGVEWSLKITTEMVDRGIVPMLGMALVFSGYAFENLGSSSEIKPKPGIDLKFWVFLISTILGLVFLAIAPIHMSNVVKARNQTIEQINKEAKDAKQQLEIRLAEQATQLRDLLATQPDLDNYVKQGNLSADELARLQKFKDDPNALKIQMATVRSNLEKQIEDRKKASEERSKVGTLKSLWRVGISCLLLASCYLTIGWTGFKGGWRPKKVRPPK